MMGALIMQKKYVFDLCVVGIRIKEARKALGLTQEKIAERVDFSGQYWSMMETGRYGGSVNTYLQIAAALGLTLNDLFYEQAELTYIVKGFDMDELLSECNDFEKAIIWESLAAIKSILLHKRWMMER